MPEFLAQQLVQLPRVPLGEWAVNAINWLDDNIGLALELIDDAVKTTFEELGALLSYPPGWVMVLVLSVLAFVVRGWGFAIFALLGLGFIESLGRFESMMQTTALIIVASVLAIVISVPVGILAARSGAVSKVVRPVLDLMQTLPPFVYLIPAVIFFSIGATPGVVATVIFALPPGVRLTELGIRQVDAEMVEAGKAFGAPPRQILSGIQLPLAMPSIMAGINQVIMLSLSMVVIAGMVGAPGLGQDVYTAVTRVQIGIGVESGLAVVILAIFVDRLTGAFGAGKGIYSRLRKPVAVGGSGGGNGE